MNIQQVIILFGNHFNVNRFCIEKYAVLIALCALFSSCGNNDASDRIVVTDGVSTINLQIPPTIASRRIEIDEYNLIFSVNGSDVPMTRDGVRWTGQIVVPPGTELNVRVAWFARDVILAGLDRNYGAVSSSIALNIAASDYNLEDSDGDGFSNISELDNETDPFDASSPGTAAPPVIRYVSSSVSVDENAGTVDIRVERLGDTSSAIAIEVSTNTEGAISATPDVDFISSTQTLSWARNEAGEKSITIQINNDNILEENETFQTKLSNLTNTNDISVFRDGVILTVTIVNVGGEGPVNPDSCGDDGGSDNISFNSNWDDNCVIKRTSLGGQFADSLYSVGIQRILFCTGFASGSDYRVFADGEYGPITEASVQQFQQSNFLVDDGIVSAQTWGGLQGQIVLLSFGELGPEGVTRDTYGFSEGLCAGIPMFYQEVFLRGELIELGGWTLARNQPNAEEAIPFSTGIPFNQL